MFRSQFLIRPLDSAFVTARSFDHGRQMARSSKATRIDRFETELLFFLFVSGTWFEILPLDGFFPIS